MKRDDLLALMELFFKINKIDPSYTYRQSMDFFNMIQQISERGEMSSWGFKIGDKTFEIEYDPETENFSISTINERKLAIIDKAEKKNHWDSIPQRQPRKGLQGLLVP